MESIKNDKKDNKDPWDLLPLGTIKWIVKVYKFGASKYGPNRWQHLDDGYQRYKGAMLRHLEQYEDGERYDKESGLPHLAHMAWNGVAMLFFDMVGAALFSSSYKDDKKEAA